MLPAKSETSVNGSRYVVVQSGTIFASKLTAYRNKSQVFPRRSPKVPLNVDERGFFSSRELKLYLCMGFFQMWAGPCGQAK